MIKHGRHIAQESDVYRNILKSGYHEYENSYVTKEQYQKTYNCFDNVIELNSKEASFNQLVADIEKSFLNAYGDIFCGAPTGYRDCIQKEGKKDQKIYFQYSSEYYALVKEQYLSSLNKFSFYKMFLDYLDKIDKKSKIIFNKAINTLEKNVPNIRQALLGNRKDLTVIIKIIRYVGNEKLCTSPHYDKSGLTLVLDNNDINNDKFIIGPYMDPFDPTKLSVPKRRLLTNKRYTSSILFPGACLRKVNVPLDPVPHGVLPTEVSFRYAIVAFCLVPNIIASDIQTTIVDKNKFIYNRNY